MKKIIIDQNLKGKELFKFLVENKDALIAQKKSIMKFCDAIAFNPSFYDLKDATATKLDNASQLPPDATKIRVKVVANTSMWCDSHMDVLLRDSATKSIKDRKGMIPHLKNHEYKIESQIGDVAGIYYEEISLMELGLNKTGTAQALCFETDIRKDYDEKVFMFYKNGRVNQHSIGLQYVKLGLAINDDEDVAHYDLWTKHIDQVINKEVCEERGYFWVVAEYKLLENSAVLFGSNILTPTLDMKSSTEIEPFNDTQDQPQKDKGFNLIEAIQLTNFFN